ncbi:hypothetical protein LZ554_009030 [Drepanopeziza brunnea f. sp. 'monogermtubi']|nr:hypothetical protein LZ554_009030 [Drepanopeziza brunnea f. sp. 'monogermtubi']
MPPRYLINLIDDIGIYLLFQPMQHLFQNIEFLNFLDDLGIFLIIRPLGKLDRALDPWERWLAKRVEHRR